MPAQALLHDEVDITQVVAERFQAGEGVLVLSPKAPDAVILALIRAAVSHGKPFKVIPSPAVPTVA